MVWPKCNECGRDLEQVQRISFTNADGLKKYWQFVCPLHGDKIPVILKTKRTQLEDFMPEFAGPPYSYPEM